MKYFLALGEVLNFTRAAEVCNVSQPALTRAIKSLEDKLDGGPLVHRERGNTHLTTFGQLMRPYFETVMAQLDEAQRRAKSYTKLEGSSLGIGLMCTIGPSRFVDLFRDFTQRFNQIDIRLQDGPARAIETKLLAGDLDVGIWAQPGPLDDRLHGLPLFDERFVIAVSPGDTLAMQGEVRLRDLNDRRYLCRVNCEYADHLSALQNQYGATDSPTPYTSDRDDWIQNMALAGLGYGFLPEHSVTLPGLAVRPLVEPEVVRTVQLVTVRGRPHGPAVGAFVHAAHHHPWTGRVGAPVTLSLDD
ncbi:MAG: LysR family transcriptional regulator [Paracoccaceae bacterium]